MTLIERKMRNDRRMMWASWIVVALVVWHWWL